MAPLTIETEVQPEGLIQVRVPDAPVGHWVRVIVEEVSQTQDDAPKERVFGRWKGQVRVSPGFDDPIEGLEWAHE